MEQMQTEGYLRYQGRHGPSSKDRLQLLMLDDTGNKIVGARNAAVNLECRNAAGQRASRHCSKRIRLRTIIRHLCPARSTPMPL